MINLTGSEKQIVWATQIRNENKAVLENEIATFKERSVRENYDYSTIISKLEKAISDLENQKSEAAWWIEHKGVAKAFLQRLYK